MGKLKDLTGQNFGRLTVLGLSHLDDKKASYWYCECSCGNKNIIIKGRYLVSGNTKSCGCLRKEHILKINKIKQKSSKQGITMSNKLPYKKELKDVWYNIKYRCYNPKDNRYEYYGGRGITVCPEWIDIKLGFFNFYNWAINNGYEMGLSIDRVDVNGNYEPNNCEWVTHEVQCNNMTKNVLITIRNKTQTLAEWSKEYDIPYPTLATRYHNGIKGMKLLEQTPETFIEKEIEVDGNIHTAIEWTEIIGIDIQTFKARYDKGTRGLELIRKPHNEIIITEVNGELLRISQIAEKYNIKYKTLKARYRNGLRGDDLIKPTICIK